MSTRVASPRQQLNEWRRRRAWALHQEGWSGRAIAKALGVTPGAVSQWLKRAREGGVQALAYGFLGDVWTSKRVAAVIQQEFGVGYHRAHVSRLLRQIGWSVQKPIQRALQRDEQAIAQWTHERWPVLQAKPKASGVPSSG